MLALHAETIVQQRDGLPMISFNDLLRLHAGLDELFLAHQRALLRLDLDRATTLLQAYETGLIAHIHDEEELMLPLYGERLKAPVGGTVEIYLREHDKLRHYIGLFKAELKKLEAATDLERGVLFLLDSQHVFKRLLVHHDNRERKFLYPLLDEVTSEQERGGLFAQLELPTPATSSMNSFQDRSLLLS